MATDPSRALQVAIVAAIKAIPTAAGSNVFDMVPPKDPRFPRVTVGAMDTVTVTADCYDGTESTIQIDVWTREPIGFLPTQNIAGAIRDRLHQGELTLDGHTLEILEVESIIYSRDPDGLTSRARISVRAQTQPADPAP